MAWSDTYYVEVHNLAKQGLGLDQIASAISVKLGTLKTWLKNNPVLKKAYDQGQADSLDTKLHSLTITQRRFLTAYAATGIVQRAVDATGICRNTHYRWLREIEAYEEAWRAASEAANDALEFEARRRAVQGVTKLKFHQGQPIMLRCDKDDPGAMLIEHCEFPGDAPKMVWMRYYTETEYSDGLLTTLLKANRPEKFREGKDTTINVSQNTNVEVLEDLMDRVEQGNVIDAAYIENVADKYVEEK